MYDDETLLTTYKLFRQRRNGSLGPLFIDRQLVITPNVWLSAQHKPTKGYANRPGWHSGLLPVAPHLKEDGRVWVECRVVDRIRFGEAVPGVEQRGMSALPIHGWYPFHRPAHQGGTWIISGELKVVRTLTTEEVQTIREAHV